MNIEINEQQIQDSVNAKIDSVVQAIITSQHMREAVERRITETIGGETVAEAVKAAISQIDAASITRSAAEAMTAAVQRGASRLIAESVATQILALQGVNTYDKDYGNKRRELLLSLTSKSEQEAEIERLKQRLREAEDYSAELETKLETSKPKL